MQILLSLPPTVVPTFAALEKRPLPEWVPACDPAGTKLGSGGGTAHLLVESWRQTGNGAPFADWLRSSRKLMIHAGGQSRRLPAYAAVGKNLAPLPVFRWGQSQRLDQSLLDRQLPLYRRLLERAAPGTVAMVAAGDVLLLADAELPELPAADVVGIGLWVEPEQASHHGVFFCPRRQPAQLDFFLQKPSPAQVRELAAERLFLVDTGVWLFSERAMQLLLAKCGWDPATQAFAHGAPDPYELYAEFGLGLGVTPTRPDPAMAGLSSAIVALPGGQFHHFGTSRELIRTSVTLQNLVLDQRELRGGRLRQHPDSFILNAEFQAARPAALHNLWVENSQIPATWELSGDHLLTGVPPNDWRLRLGLGQCLDFVPVGADAWCVRAYGIDDPFRGAVNAATTLWLGHPAADWFRQRGLDPAAVLADPAVDLHDAPLFPVVRAPDLTGELVQWLLDPHQPGAAAQGQRWLALPKLSAAQLGEQANLPRLYAQRRRFLQGNLAPLFQRRGHALLHQLDLAATAELAATASVPDAAFAPPATEELMPRVHAHMFRAAIRRHRGDAAWGTLEQEAFQLLRDGIVAGIHATPVRPRCMILEDQIVWGRAPLRLDLAGGWTDTPPYCLLHGGSVLNAAVELNGQPPIQVFVRRTNEPVITLRSIDLGQSETLRTHAELRQFQQVGSAFSVPKAALALAGFLPEFGGVGETSLERSLAAFGGGLDLSFLAAVPKGSGLGTSSILAAAMLGTLGDCCGLSWDTAEINRRTLALEQLLTTGGGWQDQLGGLTRGIKLLCTRPGLDQTPEIRWLPPYLFNEAAAGGRALLYYTGVTRVAKNILQEIVRGMFLNSATHLPLLAELGAHARHTYETLLRNDWDGLCRAIGRSWELNQALDAGTNPPSVQAILAPVQDWIAGGKLLGAGGGGFLLMLAKDETAARRIRQQLTRQPPNPRARFIDICLSDSGLQITRS